MKIEPNYISREQIKERDEVLFQVVGTLVLAVFFFLFGYAVGHATQDMKYQAQALEQLLHEGP
jgi:hypothetical protein